MNVNNALINGDIEEYVYIQQPKGFVVHVKESHVYKLNKFLYGLNQSPKGWYSRIDNYL